MLELDRIDLKILAYLENHGRISNIDLSKQVGLSASPCLQRVKRLEKGGFIKQYHAEIDWKKICSYITVIAQIKLKSHHSTYFHAFQKTLAGIPQVCRCYALCGEYDYIVHFKCKDIDTYQKISEELIESKIIVDQIVSYVVLREIKMNSYFHVEEAQVERRMAAVG